MITNFFYPIAIMEETKQSDGLGGSVTELHQVSVFNGAICMSSPKITITTGKEDFYPTFKVISDNTIDLSEGTIIKDLQSNKLFEITQDNKLKESPKVSQLNIRVGYARYYLQA